MWVRGGSNRANDDAQSILVTKDRWIQILAVTFENWSELPDDVSRLGLTERQKALQRVDIRTMLCLNGSLNVPLDDCRILFTDPRKLQ